MGVKILVLTLFIVAIANAVRLSEDEENKLFEDYLRNFNISTGRSDTTAKRQNFIRNYYKVQEHNEAFRNGTKLFLQEINQFSHLSDKEFLVTRTGYIPGSMNGTVSPYSSSIRGRLTSPSSFSWVDVPYAVGPVTDQGPCSCCTVFAVIGVIESHMRIQYGRDTKLSEQEALPCCGGCGGGTNSYVYDYAKNGATFESGLKYEAKITEQCNTARTRVRGSYVKSYYRIERGATAVENGMWHLSNVGPLATGLCIPSSFSSYKSGIYNEQNMSNCMWHAVMIVGYGSEAGTPYWLVRNSWGSWWGEQGYVRVKLGTNLCGIEDDFTYPILAW